MALDLLLFYLFGAIAVGASLLVIAQRNPIYSVLLLIGAFAALSGLYVLLEAPFVAVIQIIVYAGAIMVLFLFVVMLLNAPVEEVGERDLSAAPDRGIPSADVGPREQPSGAVLEKQVDARLRRGPMRLGALLAAVLVLELVWALTAGGGESGAFAGGSVSAVSGIGRALYTDYAFPFEVTSVLILVAMVGAVVLARRETRPNK